MRWLLIALLLRASLAHAQTADAVLSLEEALRIARENEPRIRQARAQTEAAQALVDGARAPLLPQLVGTASYQRTTKNFVARPGVNPSSQQTNRDLNNHTVNFYNFGATATQLLYDFGAQPNVLRAAKENARASQELERVSLLAVELEVRNAFFQVRAQQALLLVAQQNHENQARHVAQIEAFVEVGTRPQVDLAQARAELANARVELIRAEGSCDTAKATLNRAMGIERSTSYQVNEDTLGALDGEDAALEVLFEKALSERPELVATLARERAFSLRARALSGNYAPIINLTGGVTDAGQKLTDLGWNWNAGVTMTWPLLQGGLTRAAVHEARANALSVRAEVDSVRQQVRLELEQARVDLRAAKAVVEASQEAVRFAQERLTLAEGRYEAGVGNAIELNDAQLSFTRAAGQQVFAQYQLAAARAQLLHALGRSK